MAPVIGRLTKRPDFLRAARMGRKWAMPGLVLQARRRGKRDAAGDGVGVGRGEEQDGDAAIRVGFTASRKVGAAVERNRARRRLRAVVAQVLPELGQPGHDYVVIARGGTLTRRYQDLLGDLRTALKRVAGLKRAAGERKYHEPVRKGTPRKTREGSHLP